MRVLSYSVCANICTVAAKPPRAAWFPTRMKPTRFTYHRPATVQAATGLLAELAPLDGRVLAGGQSLVPTMAFRMARPAHLIDINGIAELDGGQTGTHLGREHGVCGASTILVEILSSNQCRCTGYENVVKAVRAVAAEMHGRK